MNLTVGKALGGDCSVVIKVGMKFGHCYIAV